MSILFKGSEIGVQRVTSPLSELADWEHLALEVAQVGAWEWNFSTGEGRWSSQLCSVLGVEPHIAALGPDGILPFVLETDRARYKNSIFAAIEGGALHSLEYRILQPDGLVRWVVDRAKVFHDENGQPVRMVGAIVDVTDSKHEEFARREIQRAATARRKADKALVETEHRLNAMLDNAPAAVYVKDLTGRLTFVNQHFLDIFRLTRSEILREGKMPPHPKDVLSSIQEHDRAVLESGRPLQFEEEIEAFGERRIFMSVKFPLIGQDAKPYALCGISADVTDQKMSQQEALDRSVELRKAVEDLNQITYLVSHDMRSPLRGVIGNARLLKDEFGHILNPAAKKHLQRIESAALKLGHLVDDLLGFCRIGRTEIRPEQVDISALSQKVLGRLRSRAECRDADVIIEGGISTLADRAAAATILDVLIHNACQYVERGSAARVKISAIPGGFCVQDHGIGIDMQYSHKIFQPFERLHRDEDFPGTGMGLAAAHRLVERHSGRIWVESVLGRGTTFYVQLEPRG
jgi:PAS domain S-box-containing protein